MRSIAKQIIKNKMSRYDTYKLTGDECKARGELNLAIELYEKYLRVQPNDAPVIASIADCYARLGHLDSAKIGYQAALEINPACISAKENLAALEKL